MFIRLLWGIQCRHSATRITWSNLCLFRPNLCVNLCICFSDDSRPKKDFLKNKVSSQNSIKIQMKIQIRIGKGTWLITGKSKWPEISTDLIYSPWLYWNMRQFFSVIRFFTLIKSFVLSWLVLEFIISNVPDFLKMGSDVGGYW